MLGTLFKRSFKSSESTDLETPDFAPAAEPQANVVVEGLESRICFSLTSQLQADFAFNLLGRYGVLGLTGAKIDITNPSTRIGGDVGIGPHGIQNFSDGRIDGALVVDPTTSNNKSNNVVKVNGTVVQNMQPTVDAAIDATNAIAAAAPTQTFGAITGSKTINSTTHLNVINVSSINLSGSAVVTLNANVNDYFFINVTGKYAMSGSSRIALTGGINTTHVIFNIIGTGEQVAFTGSSVGVGTYIAKDRDISVSGATIIGSLIGAMNHKIALTSGAQIQVNTPHFNTGAM
jgi:hypothetical protein